MSQKIKKRYQVWYDAYGKKHREHQSDGVCQMCGKAEGVWCGSKIRCYDCFDKIVKEVEQKIARDGRDGKGPLFEKVVPEQFIEAEKCPSCNWEVHQLFRLSGMRPDEPSLCANCLCQMAFSNSWEISVEVAS